MWDERAEVGGALGVAISPGVPEAAGVAERQLRAVNVEHARNSRDATRRAARARKLLRTMKWLPPTPGKPRVTLMTPSGLTFKATPARTIQATLWAGIAEKLIRGLHHAETGAILGPFEVHTLAGGLYLQNVSNAESRAFFLNLALDRSVRICVSLIWSAEGSGSVLTRGRARCPHERHRLSVGTPPVAGYTRPPRGPAMISITQSASSRRP